MIEQIAIAITGCVAIWLTNSESPTHRKYAPIFGLAGQPFWFYSAYVAEQWGILALTLWYSVAWWRGLKNGWMHKTPCQPSSPTGCDMHPSPTKESP